MDVEVQQDGPCTRTLTIKIPPVRIRDHLDEAYRSAAQQANLKGFRQGKVPRKVLEKKFGDAIRSEAKEALVQSSFREACRQHNLTVVGRPRLEGLDESPLRDEATLEFQVHFEVRPEFELGDVRNIEIDVQSTDVTDEDLETAMRQLADQKKTLDTIDEPVADGDFVRANLTFKDESGAVVHEKTAQLNTNIPIAGTSPEEFASRLLGLEKEQGMTLDLTFSATFDKPEVRGQKGSVELKVLEVLRVQAAPIDDALAKSFDFDGLDAMKETLHRRIGEEKQKSEKIRQENSILEILANDHPFDLPPSMVDEQIEHLLRAYAERLKGSRVPEEEIAQKVETATAEARQDAERRIRLFFILDAIARTEKVFVTESDVDVELRNVAAQNNVSLDEVIEYYDKHNLVPELRIGVMERKVREFLRDNAKITDR